MSITDIKRSEKDRLHISQTGQDVRTLVTKECKFLKTIYRAQ